MRIKNILSKINRRTLTNNTQRAALSLLQANGDWVSRKSLEKNISSVAARIRDLRKSQFGAFTVECSSASQLNKRGDRTAYFYRIQPSKVSKSQMQAIFDI